MVSQGGQARAHGKRLQPWRFHYNGEVVKQDYKKAARRYRLAATQGDTEAQRNLGVWCFHGTGIKKDCGKAVYRYKKVAVKNDAKAIYRLGLCRKHGKGPRHSDVWAKHYFNKAAVPGYKNAAKQLEAAT